MPILSPAISSLARLRHWRIEAWRSHPIEAQREVIQNLVTSAQYTEFGRKHGFSQIFSIKDFKKSVPISEYDDLKPYIERMMQGEQNILWNSPINWFAKSSGTTSDKSKFIPISEESLEDCHYQAAKDVLTMYYKNNPDSEMLSGKGLVIGGSHTINPLNNETQYGDLSAVLLQNSPFWGHWLRTPDLDIALMDKWEDKLEKMALQTMNENVTSISGVPTWTLILFKRLLEITRCKTISEVWPSLELYIHGGVSFTPYKDQFNSIIGKPIHYVETYNASEGFFAGNEIPGDDSMLLFTDHGIFLEFMPMSEYGKSNPATIGLKDIELGANYALVISTNGGLWRYLLGDTIKFTSKSPYKIIVSGRIKHYINAFGEEVIVDNSDNALHNACSKTGAVVNDYTAAPVYFSETSNGTHEWLIEFEKEPDSLEVFTKELDAALQAINSDYEAKRYKDIALGMPIVHNIPKGSFNNWLREKGKLGGQHKVPRLCNERKYVEEILAMNKTRFK
ncbi:MAG TPA: GH3 auxin-responsive promoter family protein [Niabella sp.]|nr:GH3 auxin-responsive promoter family protein [Niabella sp.]HOZ96535.1 GH3 auxin-responsive promoter family protein [Niabella sp.]HQW13284.1 GH3 auxin-responsive promoter family protein [Niabella sp.]HQX18676.1 GH3 auxin-responsive promoter family protein [Niabella sp.]HQX40329.1 GH3 auxin-responsive promoter family protein [Niabella sp.]